MTMFIKPVNRMMLVEKEPEHQKNNDLGILIPDSVKQTERNVVVHLVSCDAGSVYEKYEGQNLLVRANMLEDFEIKGNRFTLLSENGVIAVIAESDLL